MTLRRYFFGIAIGAGLVDAIGGGVWIWGIAMMAGVLCWIIDP